jgi:hypothetical protein
MEKTKLEITKIKYAEQIKDILVDLALEDKLPLDITTLDSSVFEEVFHPLVRALYDAKEDATIINKLIEKVL